MIMTVALAVPFNSFVGNGSANAFPFTFPVFSSSQLLVTVTDASGNVTTLNLATDYTVTGLNAAGTPASTGTVTLVNAGQLWLSGGNLATGYTLVIGFNGTYAQTYSIRNQGDFFRWFLEDALDYTMMVTQKLGTTALILPPGINPSTFSPVLPTNMPQNPGKVLMVNPAGNALILGTPVSGTIPNPLPANQGGTGAAQTLVGTGALLKSNGQTIVESSILKETSAGLAFANTSTQGVVGSATNDSAAAGNVGERVSSAVAGVNAPTSNQLGDATSISLTAGDWDVSAVGIWDASGGTWSRADIGISTTSGNSATGLTNGDNRIVGVWASTSTVITIVPYTIPVYRISIASPTTVYLKILSLYSVGTPQFSGRITARRTR